MKAFASVNLSSSFCLAHILAIVLALSACSSKSPVKKEAGTTGAEIISETPSTPETGIVDHGTLLKMQFDSGIAALSVREYTRARRIFAEMAEKNPDLSGPWANLALISFKQNNTEDSLTQVNKAIELNPRNAQAYHLRAQISLQNGSIHLASQDYQQAIELDPGYLNAHYNLALLYDIYLQEIALAIEHYSIYLKLLGKEDETLQDWIEQLRRTLENV